MWIDIVTGWTSHAWWNALVLGAALFCMMLAIMVATSFLPSKSSEEERTVVAAVQFGFLPLVLVSVFVPESWRRFLHHLVIEGWLAGVVALLAFKVRVWVSDAKTKSLFESYAGWLVFMPTLALALLRSIHLFAPEGTVFAKVASADWTGGYVLVVLAVATGLCLVWPDPSDMPWKGWLVGFGTLAATLAWAVGPVIWPLPWGLWRWGLLITLVLIPLTPLLARHLWRAVLYVFFPLKHPDMERRKRAIMKCRRVGVLERVLQDGSSGYFDDTKAAAARALAQLGNARSVDALLRAVARKPYSGVTHALDLVTESLLVERAKSYADSGVRSAVINVVKDQAVLAEWATADVDADVRKSAIFHLKDQTTLIDRAKNDADAVVRAMAIQRVTDQSVLIDRAKNDGDAVVRLRAIEKITDQAALADVSQRDTNLEVTFQAAVRLREPLEALTRLLRQIVDAAPEGWLTCKISELRKMGAQVVEEEEFSPGSVTRRRVKYTLCDRTGEVIGSASSGWYDLEPELDREEYFRSLR
jgi:hypothetical protein